MVVWVVVSFFDWGRRKILAAAPTPRKNPAELSLNGILAFAGFFLGVGAAAKIFLRPQSKKLTTTQTTITTAV